MLMVTKRSGRQEPFDVGKIQNTLAAASDELKFPLNRADLKNICGILQARVGDREQITSREIFDHLVHILGEQGFSALSTAYRSHSGNAWDDTL